MKNCKKNWTSNRMKFGSRKHGSSPRTIKMSRLSFDENGQLIGTEQVEARVQFDPTNACYQIMIDDDSIQEAIKEGEDDCEPDLTDEDLEALMSALEAAQ